MKNGEKQNYSEQLMDVLPDGIITMLPDGKVLYINSEARRMLELDSSVTTNDPHYPLYVTDLLRIIWNKEDILPSILQTLNSGKRELNLPVDSCIRAKILDTLFPIRGQFYVFEVNPGRAEIVFYFYNITSELTQSYVLETALNKSKIYPWVLDIDRGIYILDARYFDYLGIVPGPGNTLTMEDYMSMVHPDDRQGLVDAFSVQFSGGTVFDKAVPFRLHRGDGKWEWFEGQSTYIGMSAGLPYRLVGICMSIQEHKNIEESLIAARNKAEESDRLKSAFLANMSHEIRTPLNAIVGFSEVLATSLEELSTDDRRDYVDLIQKNSEQLLVLINDILDLSRIESNTMEFIFSMNSLNNIFKDIYRIHAGNRTNGVRLELEIPEKEEMIYTDSVRLKQVLNNLLNNAIKFTKAGYVRLGFKVTAGKWVQLFVEDSGVGISEEHIKHIFERFYKVDSFKQGTGLGLAICRTIVENLQGRIQVNSEQGQGTSIKIELPLDLRE